MPPALKTTAHVLAAAAAAAILWMRSKLKTTAHVLLFVLAFVVFYVGLFVGLQVNANGGTLLWIAAAVIAGLNILWMVRSGRK